MIDSCSMQFPFDVCEGFSLEKMIHSPQVLGGELISDIYKAPREQLPIGLSNINIDWKNGLVKVDASAKVLKDNYLQGITQNTFPQMIDTINKTGFLHIDIGLSFEMGVFHKIDTTNNVNMIGYDSDLVSNWKNIHPQLSNAVNNPYFRPKVYNHPNNKGITYMGDQKTEKNRLIAYCKQVELMAGKNKPFLRALNNPIALLNQSKHILRIEGNHTSFKSIKTRLKTTDTNIKNVLSNGQNPNIYLLDKITQPNKVNQLVLLLDEYSPDKFSLADVLKYEGIKGIIRKANYCEVTIKNIVKSYKCDFSYYWYGDSNKGNKKTGGWIGIQKMISQVKAMDLSGNNKPISTEIIDYIRNEIKRAS